MDMSPTRTARKPGPPEGGLKITIESINARIRRAVNARGHFPTEQAALKCVYLALMSLDPKGTGQKRWSNRWKAALNAFEITFDGRLAAGRK
jgi:putative transposase